MANTKINTNQLDDKVLTVDNLLSSDTVIIAENPKDGGIDENTKTMLHFDAYPYIDSISGSQVTPAATSYAYSEVFPSQEGFTNCLKVDGSHGFYIDNLDPIGQSFADTDSFTVDFRIKQIAQNQGVNQSLNFGNTQLTMYEPAGSSSWSNAFTCTGFTDTEFVSFPKENQLYSWTHIALVQDADNMKRYVFVDGIKVSEVNYSAYSTPFALISISSGASASYGTFIDELRISDMARWDSNFPVPTEPYHSDDDDPTTYSMHTAVDLSVFADKETDFKTPITSENLGATMSDLEEVKTSDLTFIGYISTTEPSSTDYNLKTGNLWYNSATLPSTLPISQSDLKVWDGSAWQNATSDYNPDDLDAWKDIEDGETYVYFAGEWQDYAPQLSSQYFYLDTVTGKWEIKSDVNLPGHPTVSNAPTSNMGIANKEYVDAIAGDFKRGLYDNGSTVAYGANTSISLADNTTVYTIALSGDITLAFDTTNLTIPTNAMTTFYLVLDMSNGVHNVIWPNTVQWGNVTPTMTSNACYMFSFTKPYNANIWIGNQMYSWEV